MVLEATHSKYIDIGCWQLNTATQTINNKHERKELEPLLFKTLMYFIDNQERIITRKELAEHVWQLNFVDDNTINRVIFELRKQLACDLQPQPTIKTHYRKGYSFTIPEPEPIELSSKTFDTTANSEASKTYRVRILCGTIIALVALTTVLYFATRQTFQVEITTQTQPSAEVFHNQILSWYRGHHGKLYNSPDQRYLAYNFKADTNEVEALGEVRLMDLTTQHERALSLPSGSSILGWSADSAWIYYLYRSEVEGENPICEYRRHQLSPKIGAHDQLLFSCAGGLINALFDFGKDRLIYSRRGYLDVPNLGAIYSYDLKKQQETRVTTPSNHGFGDQLLAIIPESHQLIFTRNIGDKVELLVTTSTGQKTLKLAEFPHLLWAANWNAKQKSVLWFDHNTNEIKRYSMQSLMELPAVKVAVEPTSYILPMSENQLLMTTYGYDHDSYVIDLNTGKSTLFAKPNIYEVIMAYLGDNEFAYNDSIFKTVESYGVMHIDSSHRYSPIAALSLGYSIIDSDPSNQQILVKHVANKQAEVRDWKSLDVLLTLPDNEQNGGTRLGGNKVAQLRAHEVTDDKIIELVFLNNKNSKTITVDDIVSIDWYDDHHLVTLSSNRDISLLNIETTQVTPLITGAELAKRINDVKVRPMITAANGAVYLYNRQYVYQLDANRQITTILDINASVNAESSIYYLDAHGDKLLISYLTRYHNEIKLYRR
ncbi:winged helix-turn-helix domain-containing protein [Pseudoalteromonas piscicida]|uniref:winged helix-turn-helix domain-containing protein n=1 Tax=Pseudoalteromonas piscicida TaxID=43662 RepID=UPI000E35FC88|nr:winged helix-turn-helix domain-containing protein [Pseudoalteromonas piscicida]AXQ99385.1 winged helix family transcriptional regulator [Pseudoalteromonas piscicida]